MYRFFKRIINIIFSLTALLILMPLFVPVIILLLLTGEHKVFYLQERIGYKNRHFNIVKFATMLKNSPNMGTGSITLRNDPRVTPMGGFLRKSKINEFPQIFNIFLGDISLVGPRPLVDRTFKAYTEDIQSRIYNVKPGLTGIGSIVFRDEESLISNSGINPHEYYKQVIAPYKGALEMWYQERASFFLDLKIIFLTAWVIVFPKSEIIYTVFKGLPERPQF